MDPLNIYDNTMVLLRKSLDLRAANQNVIAANIANAETPGYAPARLEFEDALKQAIRKTGPVLQTTHPAHITAGAATLSQVSGTIVREPDNTGIGDENGVSVDDEMIALSKNQLMYETDAQLIKKKIGLIKYVVQGGQ